MSDMKKKIVVRAFIGAPMGLAISTAISIAISLVIGDGQFYAVVPELMTSCGTEINAVLLQAVCSLLYGAAWGGASVIWEMDDWSILRQTATHFVICSLATFPMAYFMRWMGHDVLGISAYFAIFLAVYCVIWLSQYAVMKKRVQQMNSKIAKIDRAQS